jgi:DNA invertase Pin-like site-specific DNA recombinase
MPAPRAALYARVSTTSHGQDVGLQLEELRRVAAQRGWNIVGEYVDHGISGVKDSRPALDRMLVDAREGRLDLIAIWKLDRLARSVRHLLEVGDCIQAWGVGLVSVRDAHIDTTTPSGRFTLQILGAVAELEVELVRERVVAGVRRAQAAGKHCGRPKTELDLRPALAMLDKGHGLKAVAKAVGVSRSTLRRRLEESGEWPRRGGSETARTGEGGG